MASLLFLVGMAIAVLLGAVWLYERWRDVDSYHEREYEWPAATDLTSWFGGDRR
jgi:hypothetical protein